MLVTQQSRFLLLSQIQNVVASCRVTEAGVTIDLRKLVLKARNAEFQPKVSLADCCARRAACRLAYAPRQTTLN
jgi:hypothetical protein